MSYLKFFSFQSFGMVGEELWTFVCLQWRTEGSLWDFILLIYFWLCWVSIAALGLVSNRSESGPLSTCDVQASHCGGFSCCGAPGSVVAAPGLQSTGSAVALRPVGSPQIRDRTRVSRVGTAPPGILSESSAPSQEPPSCLVASLYLWAG